MRRTTRRSGGIALLAALVAVPTGLPAAAQSGSATQITQRHSILTELGATGEVSTSRVFTQLTVAGDGPATVTLPDQPTQGLRSLDGFRGPEIAGDDVVWNVSATPAGTRGRTVADNSADLPVDVSVRYALDGRDVEPSELVGRSGRLAVTYTVVNTTAEPVEIHPTDARGERQSETIDVAVPMVGSLALTLPPNFTAVDARGANVAGDGRGNTVVNYSLLLFAPLGDETQEVTYHANVTDAVVPGATIQVLPVDESSFTSLTSTSLAYREATDGTQRLGYGAQLIDTNVLKLADGAAQLLDGLTQLSDGADELSAGLSDTAAPGARQLADGTGQARSGAGQLATGLGELSLGANRLRDGLGDANRGAGALAGGLTQLRAGAVTLRDGVSGVADAVGDPRDGIADGTVLGGVNALRSGIAGLPDTVRPQLEAGLAGALNDELRPLLSENLRQALAEGLGDTLQDTVRPQLSATLEQALADALTETLEEQVAPQLVTRLRGGLTDALQGPFRTTTITQLRAALTGLLMGAPFNLPQPNAAAIADAFIDGPDAETPGFAAAFGAGLTTFVAGFIDGPDADTPGFEDQLLGSLAPVGPAFAEGFVDGPDADTPGFDAALGQSFGELATRFADGFVDGPDPETPGFDAALGAGFTEFATAFATAFATGLRSSIGSEALPGFDRLLGGLNNPGCDTTNPTDAANPCGLRQVLGLLSDGSQELAAGAGTASSGAQQLDGGLTQLADGSGDLAAGASTAATGGRDLAAGIGQLDDGASQLADGLGDAADGSTQLAEGLTAAEDGGTQVAEGSVALSEQGMSALIDGISDAKLGASRNLETIKAVSDRGRGFDGPFGTAARADASTVWQFEVAGVGDAGGAPSTTTVALLALLALGVAGGAGALVRRRLV